MVSIERQKLALNVDFYAQAITRKEKSRIFLVSVVAIGSNRPDRKTRQYCYVNFSRIITIDEYARRITFAFRTREKFGIEPVQYWLIFNFLKAYDICIDIPYCLSGDPLGTGVLDVKRHIIN